MPEFTSSVTPVIMHQISFTRCYIPQISGMRSKIRWQFKNSDVKHGEFPDISFLSWFPQTAHPDKATYPRPCNRRHENHAGTHLRICFMADTCLLLYALETFFTALKIHSWLTPAWSVKVRIRAAAWTGQANILTVGTPCSHLNEANAIKKLSAFDISIPYAEKGMFYSLSFFFQI